VGPPDRRPGPAGRALTKPLAAPALGLELTARLAAGASLPCVAIGGIHAGNAAQVRATGVDGIAVVSAVCAAPNPEAAAAALCRTEPEQARR